MSFLNLGELTALSYNHSDKMLNDTYYNQHVLLASMKRVRETYPGGLFIQKELGIAGDRNDQTGAAIAYTGGWDYTTPELFDAARFLPKIDVQVIVIWDIEVSRSGTSETQYLDLIKERQKWYTKIKADRKSRYLYGRSDAVKPNGLADVFDNTQPFGEIDRTKDKAAGYRSFVFHNNGTGRALTRKLLSNSLTKVTDNNIMPDIGITTPDMRDDVELMLADQERYSNTALANAGFENLEYRGIPIVFDKEQPIPGATRQNFYWLNFDYLQDKVDERYNNRRYPWMRMPNNPGQFEVIMEIGNVVSGNLRYLSMIQDLMPTHDGMS